MSEHQPVTAEELAEVARLDVTHCTGISAGWCPVHGDCVCPYDEDNGHDFTNEACPLHGTTSAHGDDEEDPPPIARSLILRLAHDLAERTAERDTAQASIRGLIEAMNEAQADRDALARHVERLIREAGDIRADERKRAKDEQDEAVSAAHQRAIDRVEQLEGDNAKLRRIVDDADRVKDENETLRRDLASTRAELKALHDVLSGAKKVST